MCSSFCPKRLIFKTFIAAAIFACQSSVLVNKCTAETGTLRPNNLIYVPLTRQSKDYTCGVAALQSVLAYYGHAVREDILAKACKSNHREGTRYTELASYAKSKGFTVDIRVDATLQELEGLLDRKLPAICLIQAWADSGKDYAKDWDDGHYVVAVGYNSDCIYFMDPSTLGNYTFIPKAEFLQRWHDTDGRKKYTHFMMIVSKAQPAYDPVVIKKLE